MTITSFGMDGPMGLMVHYSSPSNARLAADSWREGRGYRWRDRWRDDPGGERARREATRRSARGVEATRIEVCPPALDTPARRDWSRYSGGASRCSA